MIEYEIKVVVKVTGEYVEETARRARFVADALEEAAGLMDADLEETNIEEIL